MINDFQPETLIPEQTAVVTEPVFVPIQQRFRDVTIVATNLGANEEIPIFFSADNGETFEEVFQEGSAVILTETDNVKSVVAPLLLGVTKPVTVGTVGVFLFSNTTARQK